MTFNELMNNPWMDAGVSVLVFVLVAIIARLLINLVIGRIISRIAERTKTSLDDFLVKAVRSPLYWLLVTIALEFSIKRLSIITQVWRDRLNDIFFILYALLVFQFVWRTLVSLFEWYSKEVAPNTETNLDEQILPFLRRVIFIILFVLTGIILLDRFNIEVSALVTTLGIGSLAIALAAQAALSDTISGFIIMIDRPFRIGDRIELLDLDTWGDVVDIGLRSSRIRTRDNRMVIVPNSLIVKSLVVNHSFPDTEYRIQIELGIAYGSDLEFARETIIKAVSSVEGVLLDHPVEALFLHFGDSALTIRVRWWIESYVDTRRMFDRVNSAIYRALEDAGVEVPFPQQDIHHKIDEGDIPHFTQVMHASD